MSDLSELIEHYFALGVAEGKEGRNHDTPTGEAQATLDLITIKLDRIQIESEQWREANRKLHRRCQQAERVHAMTVGYLSSWLEFLRNRAGKKKPDRVLFRWAIQDLHRKANLASRALPLDAKERKE